MLVGLTCGAVYMAIARWLPIIFVPLGVFGLFMVFCMIMIDLSQRLCLDEPYKR